MPLYIDYQATIFKNQYSFKWHFCFNDISTQSYPLQKARLLTATLILGLVPNQGFKYAQKRLAYQTSLYFFETIDSTASLYLRNSCSPQNFIGSATRFEPSQPAKTSTKPETWGFTSPQILKYYVVKALYVPEVIRTELKNNQAKKEHYDLSLVIVNCLTISDACIY